MHRWLALVILCVFVAPLWAAKKNVVVFVTDDQSPDFGAYGNPVMKTPHMDALAEQGTLYRSAFCTTASCSASRSVILTGLQNHANGQYGHQHHFHKFSSYDNIISLPVYLSAAGYRTARCGKYHVAPEAVFQFETVIGGVNSRSPVEMAEKCNDFISPPKMAGRSFFISALPIRIARGTAEELPHKPDRFGNPKPGKSYPV